MSDKTFRVLDQYREHSAYEDEIGRRYHFPGKYRQLLSAPNIQFIYHEPKKKGKGDYFGCGEIGTVTEDPNNPDQFFADILNYRAFAIAVPDSDAQGRPKETPPYYNAQNAVRQVEPLFFNAVCTDGGIKAESAPGMPVQESPGPKPAEGTPAKPSGLSYWWLNANPKVWNLEETPVGGKQTYTSHNERGNKRQKYRYFQEVKPNDLIIG